MSQLSPAAIAATPSGISVQAFAEALQRVWASRSWGAGPPRRIGLAISGGVDSMALASLCSRLEHSTNVAHEFTAFVVDHRLRPGSAEEAQLVRRRLEQLYGIETRVLTLGTAIDGNQSSRIETVARRRRYGLIGVACAEAGIGTLLTAHHLDDHANTVLMRIVQARERNGLGVMRQSTLLPECEGMYGVHQSGHPRQLSLGYHWQLGRTRHHRSMMTEEGGVRLVRPLLAFSKSQLISTCSEEKVDWVEDTTNSDKQYTIRNTLVYMNQMGLLPAAFNSSRLCRLSSAYHETSDQLDHLVQECLEESDIRLNLATGRLRIKIPITTAQRIHTSQPCVKLKMALLRKLVSVITPSFRLLLPDFSRLAKLFLSHDPAPKRLGIVQAVLIDFVGKDEACLEYEFARCNPPRWVSNSAQSMSTSPYGTGKAVNWSRWQMWDGRFWARVGHRDGSPAPPSSIAIRFLRHDDSLLVAEDELHGFRSALRRARLSPSSRYNLPVLTVSMLEQSTGTKRETVVALPSLGWASVDFKDLLSPRPKPNAPWLFEIRYKKIPEIFTVDA